MNFRQRSNDFDRRNNRNKFIPAIIFVVVILLLIFSFSWPRNILFSAVSPLWKTKNAIASFFADDINLLKSKSALIAENNSLKAQIQIDMENQYLLQIAIGENNDLKNILNRKDYNPKEILAAVLVKPFLSPFDTLIIDIGKKDGISAGDEVMASSTYIGFISEVYDRTSKVVLYSSDGQKFNVLVGKNSVQEQAIGLGGGDFSLQIPVGTAVNVGDPIVMPSVSLNVFSNVEKIEAKPTDSFETVLFKNPVNIEELKWVEVLPDNKK